MMKPGHYAAATPLGLGMAWGMVMLGLAPWFVGAACWGIVIRSSTWPDLDHPRFKGKMHPGAALVRGTGWVGYRIRTDKDKDRDDFHRGPSHCIEWAILAGVAVGLLTAQIPWVSQWALWWGLAVFMGCASHILADLPTPSGVPLCATYNYFKYGEVWRRHSLRWFSTDSAGEKFIAVPILFALSGVMLMAMVGVLDDVLRVLLPGWL